MNEREDLICEKCGAIIPDGNVAIRYGESEGDSYTIFEVYCDCGHFMEMSSWGEEDIDEMRQALIDSMK